MSLMLTSNVIENNDCDPRTHWPKMGDGGGGGAGVQKDPPMIFVHHFLIGSRNFFLSVEMSNTDVIINLFSQTI